MSFLLVHYGLLHMYSCSILFPSYCCVNIYICMITYILDFENCILKTCICVFNFAKEFSPKSLTIHVPDEFFLMRTVHTHVHVLREQRPSFNHYCLYTVSSFYLQAVKGCSNSHNFLGLSGRALKIPQI